MNEAEIYTFCNDCKAERPSVPYELFSIHII